MVSQADVPPGGEAKIEVKIKTKGHTGLMSKTVRVQSNDPKNPTLKLTLKGTIEVEVGFARAYVRIPTISLGEEKAAETKFMVKDRTDFKVLGIESSTPSMTATLKPLEGTTDEALVITYKGTKVGRFNETVTIKTNRAGYETLKLTVTGMVQGDIDARPKNISFQIGSSRTEQNVVLRSKKKPFKVLKVHDVNKLVKTSVEKGATNKEWKIKVTLIHKGTERASTQLVITTDSKEQPTVTIPVYLRPKAALIKKAPKRSKKRDSKFKVLRPSHPEE